MSEILHRTVFETCLADQTEASWEEEVRLILAHDAALRAALAELTTVCRESNAVCACGCPESGHESYGEDGESCGVEGHECVRTSRTVAGMLVTLRAALAEAQRELRQCEADRDAARTKAHDVEARAATMSMMLDTIEGVATGQPGEIPATVDKGWSSALPVVVALLARAESAERELAEAREVLAPIRGLRITAAEIRAALKSVMPYGPGQRDEAFVQVAAEATAESLEALAREAKP